MDVNAIVTALYDRIGDDTSITGTGATLYYGNADRDASDTPAPMATPGIQRRYQEIGYIDGYVHDFHN